MGDSIARAALAICPADVAADILLRAVEEGSCSRERAEADANVHPDARTLCMVRERLGALQAFAPPCVVFLPIRYRDASWDAVEQFDHDAAHAIAAGARVVFTR